MSLLSTLKLNKGAKHADKRRGRGDGSGQGGTAGKGHKGQKARTGGRVRRGFEGGQMPLHRRMPKVGFNNIFREEFNVVNLEQISKLQGTIDMEALKKARLVRRVGPVKLLAKGKIQKALTVKVHAVSETAKKAVENAGGKVEVIK